MLRGLWKLKLVKSAYCMGVCYATIMDNWKSEMIEINHPP